MKYFGNAQGEKHKKMGALIRKKNFVEEALGLFSEIHAELHQSVVSGTGKNEIDGLVSALAPQDYAVIPGGFDETIAWNLWHIARIEDLTMNILIDGGNQVFDEAWRRRTGAEITDTGNAMSVEEILSFSKAVVPDELLAYRRAVGVRTREIVARLGQDDMKRKVRAEDCKRILSEGGVTEQENSVWLLDYWGGKDVAGLLMMPPTRHEILHINSCFAIKAKLDSTK